MSDTVKLRALQTLVALGKAKGQTFETDPETARTLLRDGKAVAVGHTKASPEAPLGAAKG